MKGKSDNELITINYYTSTTALNLGSGGGEKELHINCLHTYRRRWLLSVCAYNNRWQENICLITNMRLRLSVRLRVSVRLIEKAWIFKFKCTKHAKYRD